jgi:hypothetical protein
VSQTTFRPPTLMRLSVFGSDVNGRPIKRWRERPVCECAARQADDRGCCRRCFGAVPDPEEAEQLAFLRR